MQNKGDILGCFFSLLDSHSDSQSSAADWIYYLKGFLEKRFPWEYQLLNRLTGNCRQSWAKSGWRIGSCLAQSSKPGRKVIRQQLLQAAAVAGHPSSSPNLLCAILTWGLLGWQKCSRASLWWCVIAPGLECGLVSWCRAIKRPWKYTFC